MTDRSFVSSGRTGTEDALGIYFRKRASLLLTAAYVSILLTVCFFCLSPSFAAEMADKKGKPAGSKTQSAKGNINPVTEAAMKAGVKTCADRINQVSNFLTSGSEIGWLLMMPKSQPDKMLVSASMEVKTKEVPAAAYVSESFTPNPADSCSGIYETVIYWDSACPEVAKKEFASLKAAGALSKNISVLDGGGSMKVFLMPAGKGCVAIKKEVLQ